MWVFKELQVLLHSAAEKNDNTYISVFYGELNIISSLQSFQITLELAVVKEDLLDHISPLNESKGLLKGKTHTVGQHAYFCGTRPKITSS